MPSLEGRQLGNYDIIRRIRSGGMGAVYEGRQRTAFGRRVAIKVILGDYAGDREMRRSFAREARTIARLHHPHILPLIEFGDEQGVLYLVMPFIENGTLSSYLRHHLPDLDEAAAIFLQLLDAVEYAHEEGLIHRDIKASNVLLEARRSGPPYAYLADFGLVRTVQQGEYERARGNAPLPLDQVPGTPHYMAPEQTWGEVTPATDIYALGVLLFQLLTGELPYDHPDDLEVIKMHLHAPVPNPCALDASIPAELGAVVVCAMAKRAAQRFSSIDALRAALQAALTDPLITLADEPFTIEGDDEPFEIHELPPRAVKEPRASREELPAPSPLPPLSELRRNQARRKRPEPLPPSELLPLSPLPPLTERHREQPNEPSRLASLLKWHKRDEEDQGQLPDLHVEMVEGGPLKKGEVGRQKEPGQDGAARMLDAYTDQALVEHRERRTDDYSAEPSFSAHRVRVTDDYHAAPPSHERATDDYSLKEALDEATRGRGRQRRTPTPHSAPTRGNSGLQSIPQRNRSGSLSAPIQKQSAAGSSPALNAPIRRRGGFDVQPRAARPARRSVRSRVTWILGVVGALLLIVGIAASRIVNLGNLLPGQPSFGGVPGITITVTAQTRRIGDTFLLTALPQITQPDLATRVLPDHNVTTSVNGSKSVTASGTREVPGTQASGTLLFSNGGTLPVSVFAGTVFKAGDGVQVRLVQTVVVPGRAHGSNGTASGSGTAVQVGLKGNLAAGALNVSCCGGLVSVSNPVAFSGGGDAQVIHLVAQSDLDGVQTALLPGLETQATQQIDGRLALDEGRAGTPTFRVTVNASSPVGSEATQVSVSINVTASAFIYNTRFVNQLASQLLTSEARQTLGAAYTLYQLRGNFTMPPLSVEQQGSAGRVYLSVAISGVWTYAITTAMQEQWKQAIKGKSLTFAQNYLHAQPGVSSVRILPSSDANSLPADAGAIVFVVA